MLGHKVCNFWYCSEKIEPINRQREWKTHVGNVSNGRIWVKGTWEFFVVFLHFFLSLKWFLEKRKVVILSRYVITRFRVATECLPHFPEKWKGLGWKAEDLVLPLSVSPARVNNLSAPLCPWRYHSLPVSAWGIAFTTWLVSGLKGTTADTVSNHGHGMGNSC